MSEKNYEPIVTELIEKHTIAFGLMTHIYTLVESLSDEDIELVKKDILAVHEIVPKEIKERLMFLYQRINLLEEFREEARDYPTSIFKTQKTIG